MKIFVVGGSGRVATELIKNLVADGHQVITGSRHPEKIIKLNNVTSIKLDLHDSVDQIAEQIKGSDAVYFVAGSRGQDLLQTDAFGAVKTMQASEKVGIRRYVMLSAYLALQPEKWSESKGIESLKDYYIAKFFADNYLVKSTQLDYTIIQPTELTEKPGTSKISFDLSTMQSNPIPDVAKVLSEVLKYKNTIGKVINMHGGDVPINEALSKV